MIDVCQICHVATFISLNAQNTVHKNIPFCLSTTDMSFGCNFHLQIEMIELELCSPASSFVQCDFLSVTMPHPCDPPPSKTHFGALCHIQDEDHFSITSDAQKYYIEQLHQIYTVQSINSVYYSLYTC